MYFILVFASTVDYWSSKFDEGNYFYLSYIPRAGYTKISLFEIKGLTHGEIISLFVPQF